MFTGFKNFLMRGDIIVVAVGLAIALAFSALIASFTVQYHQPDSVAGPGKPFRWPGRPMGNANNKRRS